MYASEARTMPKRKSPPPSQRPGDKDMANTTVTLRWEQIVAIKQEAAERQRERGYGRADMSEVVRVAVDEYFARRRGG
jgi:hypothetical protein